MLISKILYTLKVFYSRVQSRIFLVCGLHFIGMWSFGTSLKSNILFKMQNKPTKVLNFASSLVEFNAHEI